VGRKRASFSYLFTIFHGRLANEGHWSLAGDKYVEYGTREAGDRIGFEGRMLRLSKVSEKYFAFFPRQELEGALVAIVAEAYPLSRKRNHLAHSVLRVEWRATDKTWPNSSHGPPYYSVMPPWYAAKSLTTRDGPNVPAETPEWMGFSYRSAEIDSITGEFSVLGAKVDALTERIYVPDKR
jgi:hypothetical protein